MIIRVEHRKRFTVITDQALRDSEISFRATGVLAYLLSLPDGAKISGRQMTGAKREGRDAVLAALRELEGAGYLRRHRVQGPSGTWQTVCVLSELPPSPDFQDSVPENPQLPSPENQDSVFQDSKALIPEIEYQDGDASLENPQPPPLDRDELRRRVRALRQREESA